MDPKQAAELERQKKEIAAKSAHEKILAERKLLPMFQYREQLLDAVAQYQIVVIVGETGSGKTTQVRSYNFVLYYVPKDTNSRVFELLE